ncbi:uracil-xanthine permease family protein [Pseudomonas sp. NPDC090202]|uniref:uracil-xanthine permease family protein n=1 Tax=unclassified Pseudomonas TaxID=196821 RepID=UPI00382F2C76
MKQDEFNDPLWRTVLSGAQMLFVAFGALVLMPLITGLDPNVALFTAGLGTLCFQVVTGRQVPVFLASSFAFITPIILAKGQFGLAATMGGVMAAGFVYTFLGLAVKIKGTGFIDRLLPPVVIGPVVISIGLAMAPIAANMAMGRTGDGAAELLPYHTAITISMAALLTTLIVAVFGKGIFRLVPIISGVLVGFALSFWFGAVDTAKIAAAPWLELPKFTAPEFNWQAILFIVPVALAPAIEHIGGVIAVGSVTGRDYLKKPGLHRTLLGDGIATTVAGAFGGPPNTTYAEVTGAVMLTKNYNPKIMTWAAVFAITLAFIGKFGALLQSIPVPVMGGILCLLFGSIAAVGLNTMIRHKVDLAEARNLVIVSVTLVFGIGGVLIGTGNGPDDFGMKGIALCAVTAILLNLILPGNDGWKNKHLDDQLP